MNNSDLNTHATVTPELNFWWADADKRNRNVSRWRLRFWELVIISEGYADFFTSDQQIRLKKNDYILLTPATGQHLLKSTGEWSSHIISFEDSLQKIASGVTCTTRPNREIRIPFYGTIEGNPVVPELINRLCSCWQKQSISREQAGILTESLLLLLTHMPACSEEELRRPLWEMARIYLVDHWNKDWYVDDIAKELGCSTGYLARVFRNAYQMTMRQMQMQIRIEKACLYMLSGLSLHEVATSCGFHDYYHFLRVFKEVAGVTTSEFLRKNNA